MLGVVGVRWEVESETNFLTRSVYWLGCGGLWEAVGDTISWFMGMVPALQELHWEGAGVQGGGLRDHTPRVAGRVPIYACCSSLGSGDTRLGVLKGQRFPFIHVCASPVRGL